MQQNAGNQREEKSKTEGRVPAKRHTAMIWAQRLKRVFNIDISICEECGGAVKVIASIEDPHVIKQILSHLEQKAVARNSSSLPECRAPPLVHLSGLR